MFGDLKKMFDEMILPKFQLKALSKSALEALAFVLINRLKEVCALIPGTIDDDLVNKLAVEADKIDPTTDRHK